MDAVYDWKGSPTKRSIRDALQGWVYHNNEWNVSENIEEIEKMHVMYQ